MIAAYIHKETGREIYVQDFTAVVVKEKMRESKVKIVIFLEKDNSTTFVVEREIFEKEYILKNNN